MCEPNLSDESLTEKFKREFNEQFHILVRMHLSFLLDQATNEHETLSEKNRLKKWSLVPFNKKKSKGALDGAPLTQEGICQVYQLIEFLKKEQNIKVEGVFRRTGSLARQQELRNLLSRGVTLELEGGTYSIHDCASVLKGFLAELPDPLLTEAHYPAYCQIAELCVNKEKTVQEEKLLAALQLLLLLLPNENKVLLKDILDLLNFTASFESFNRMSADNLAKLFTPHLLCPRKLTPEQLHVTSQTLAGIVSFMIVKNSELFKIPQNLILEFRARYEKRRALSANCLNESATDQCAASTVFTFVDQERTAKENETNTTETALAQLYAHIQSLPESSKKRKLVKQFNKENGHGTPLQVLRSGVQKNKSLGDSIKKHIFHKSVVKSLKKRETMMTPRSRKPVLLVSGTNINTLAKIETVEAMDEVPEEVEKDNSLSQTFREYLENRSMLTTSSPAADSSFSSRTDDFNSDLSPSKMTDSLLSCLDGNDPGSEKELVLKPKQFDENGQPIVFETSF
ncbi:rho GTPase-activating protein 19 isoform X4 [Tribolium castaneum]|uniref:rho GTPase-activating protein 19 isoform X4 n=1 Tax=Tribolium castaneum TaxID=7070 RepID=UPI00077DBC65|nr:PREDICTED: rho GTPase-activating protein 19 isoform X4 [Tribolium castaneum]|eukprot:XP_015839448.1 PREDICTED: rho GTPase-activating protein 19 isoform X4 [Tribolium castaneum]